MFGVDSEYLDEHPELAARNMATLRNEGFLKSLVEDSSLAQLLAMNEGKGQELWRRAKRVIPGGNMFLSKRAEMFLQNSGLPTSHGHEDVKSGILTAAS